MIARYMELRQLESLVAIVDGGSFSRAAITLNLAQPSLSRQIALLEGELGQRLLVRTGRGVVLSPAGEAFIVHARNLLDEARRARDAMQDLGADPGGASRSACRRVWRWVFRYRSSGPSASDFPVR